VNAAAEMLTVLVPCRNEEAGVGATVAAILAERPRLPMRLEVVLIDDGSSDGTRRALEEICARHPECRMRVNPRNLGVGRSVLDAYRDLAPESWVTVMPGDNEIVFASVHSLLAKRGEHDVILGYLQNPVIRTLLRRLASQAFTLVVSFLYGFSYRYLNGMKLYRASAFQELEIRSSGHAFNAELLAKAVLRNPALRIGEAPFMARGRARGASKAFRPGSILRALWDVVIGARSVARFRREIIEREGV
jgi:glycosyltransferase involved in cell wall biosynthesis